MYVLLPLIPWISPNGAKWLELTSAMLSRSVSMEMELPSSSATAATVQSRVTTGRKDS